MKSPLLFSTNAKPMKKTILSPLLALAGCFAAFNGSSTLQAQTTNIWNFNYSGSIVTWTVPSTGYYDVTAYGAQGGGFTAQYEDGTSFSVPGGRGAVIGGLFLFEQGEVLSILAGGAGGADFASGGGGSFVVNSSTNPLVVAGGGGGTGFAGSYWPSASITTSGNNATYLNENRQGSGGTNGTGGTVGSSSWPKGGAGGGGFFGNGQSHNGPAPSWASSDLYSVGGTSYLGGGAGGSGGYFYIREGAGAHNVWTNTTVYAVDGGFGGGGQGLYAGGGGGGYSGGGGGGADVLFGGSGGGGGSFLATSASNDVMRVGHTGNGSVSISAAEVSLVVGNNSSNQSITNSSGTNNYYNIVIGGNVGDTNNSVSVTNAGTVVNAANYILVGQNGSNNTMTVSGGASVADQAFSVVGLNATASGNSLLVTGTGSTWSSGGLVIGYSGSGNSMSVEAGAGAVSAGSGVALGYNVGSTGNSLLVDGTGSTLASDSDLIVGFGGSFNSVVVSNGGNLTNSHYTYGGVIGLNASSLSNSVLVTGTGSTWSNSGNLTIGDAGEGTLTIANGGSASASSITIASQVGSTGTLNFGSLGGSDTAGSLIGPGISFGSGSGTINFNQVDTLIGSGFSGNGSVNQLGNGTTTLTGTNTYTGMTTVNSGTLVVEGQSSLGTSSVTVNGGTLVASGAFTEFPLALNAGNMTLTGAGSSWNTGTNPLSVGNSSQGASVVVADGASVVSDRLLALGIKAGASNNTVLVTGSGSSWSTASGKNSYWDIAIGYDGSSNSLVVSNGGQVSATYSFIGRNTVSSNNSVLVTGSGSRLSMAENILIGESGSGNSLVISDGGSVSSISAYIGANAGSSNNSVLVTGSGSSLSSNSYYGTIIGYAGEGTLTVANGGVAASTEPQGITVASQSGSIGTLNIGGFGSNDTAGTINAPAITFGAGTGTINFNQSDSTTISAAISGNGSVNQLGSGTTTLAGNNAYTGGTTLLGGTLQPLHSNALGSGSLYLSSGMLEVGNASNSVGLFVPGHITWASSNAIVSLASTGNITTAGNFTHGGNVGNRTFDFGSGQYLQLGNNTLVNFGATTFNATHFQATYSPGTSLSGNFQVVGNSLVYVLQGGSASGSVINNSGTGGTQTWMDFTVNGSATTATGNNTIRSLTFANNGNLSIQAGHSLMLTQGQVAVENGTSVVSGGTLATPGNFNKTGSGELDVQSKMVVGGTASINEGLLSVNGQLIADSVVVNPNATLGGAGLIVGNVNVNGNLSPGNSPGTLAVAGNLVLTGANSTIIEIASLTNFDRIVVSGQATLGGTLSITPYGGNTLAYGQQYNFLTAGGGIAGEFDTITAPETFRGRFLNLGTTGVLLIAPDTYTRVAVTPNQRDMAKALDSFIPATSGDRETVSIALDLQTAEQFPSAFDQIMPGFYESLANIAIEQAFAQTQMLNQRISSVRLGAAGFQAIGGISQPLVHDKNGKSAADAKDASPIVESATATNWNSWALGTGLFSRSTNLPNLQNYNNDAGGFLVGADYRWSENFVTGLYAGYDYSYAEYNGGGSTKGNSVNFGTYASYAKDGYYADAVIGGGYTGFQTKRSIQFSTIDRTASADPNSGQFTAGINLGKDFEVGQFTLGPIVGAQYTYAGIGGFTESGAESLDLSLGQQNANSLRSTLGGRIAYTWNLNQKIALIPEVRMFWQHEFLNNARNINASLDGGNGAAFDFETGDPYRNSVFAGAGVTAQFGERWNASVFYNVNFGSQTYQSNMVSAGLNFSF